MPDIEEVYLPASGAIAGIGGGHGGHGPGLYRINWIERTIEPVEPEPALTPDPEMPVIEPVDDQKPGDAA